LPSHKLKPIEIETIGESRDHANELLARPVSFHHLGNALYENRRNRAEANYVAQLVRGLLQLNAETGQH